MDGPQNATAPRISYQLSSTSKHFVSLKVNGGEIYKVENADEFYRALGYTHGHRRRGILPDEYIWLTYTADGSSKTQADLQANIIKYLSRHSAAFIEKYAGEYEGWLDRLNA